jgi:hypothetical protein
MENDMAFLKNSKVELESDPVTLVLEVYPNEENHHAEEMYSADFRTILFLK